MSWQRNAASGAAGLFPYVLGALGMWAINEGNLRITARSDNYWFLVLVAVGLAIAFVGPYLASWLSPMNLARAAYFGLLVHALGCLFPALVAASTGPRDGGWLSAFAQFYLATGAVTVPLALAGGVTGSLVQERARRKSDSATEKAAQEPRGG